jgi:DNA polymerase-3 subunit alpha
MNFVHLHLHTDYSLLDGACEIGELTTEAARCGMPAVAVTDHGNLFAAANFYHQATTRGVKPIIGCEVYVAPDSHKNRGSDAKRSNHLVLLCENEEGYRNLVQLVSTGFLDGFYYKPRVDHELLAQHSKGVIALSACLRGEVADAILADKYDQARANAYRLRDIFGKGNFFLEVQDQGLEIEIGVNRELVKLSRETGIPLVATNDCHYLTRADSHAHEVLLCIQTGKTMSNGQRMKFATDQFYFKTAEEMAQVFRDLPDALERTVAIAERCNVKIRRVSNPFPEFKVPEGYTADSYFEKVVREGFESRLPQLERLAKENLLRHLISEYERRLTAEIEMIKKMRFAGYFLIVWDFIHYARAQGVPVGPGRGSAAGSLVGYSLRITDVDPLQYDLLFERFLNPERISMPDIDIDFCMRRRGEVIDYVRQKYGEKNVAQIITFGTMAAKAVLKDAGRALDMPYGEVDKIAKLIPTQLNIELEEALKQSPQLESLRQSDERVKELVEVALRLEGLARHASTHAAGVIISPQPLTEIVPLYKSNKDEITTQYDMNALERIGLLKMDFLGLTTLTVLNDAVRLIEENRGISIDISALPLDDEATYRFFARGDTTGIFQFESDGMRDILRRYRPARLDDLIALNALYRPGPIQGGMIDDFIAHKHGKKKVRYDLPELEEILAETWGVILYQEQVMQIANRLAGFSLGDADILRRAMGKKKPEEMAAQREKFLAGCNVRNVPVGKAEHIFDLLAKFAEYGFNKSHSSAYALLAYRTAWLKAHYPVEFMASLLTSEIGNRDKLIRYSKECREMGIRLLSPDVNSSDLAFQPEGNCIRFGLTAIKNVGEAAVRSVLSARQRVGHFHYLGQFCHEVDLRLLNRRAMESLIKAGALDSLGSKRAQMVTDLPTILERVRRLRKNGSGTLANTSKCKVNWEQLFPSNDIAEWCEAKRLAGEREVIGVCVSGNLLDKHASALARVVTHTSASLGKVPDGARVVVAGVLAELHVQCSRKGNRWAKATLDDVHGAIELIVFANPLQRFESVLRTEQLLIVKGRVRRESDSRLRVFADEFVELYASDTA